MRQLIRFYSLMLTGIGLSAASVQAQTQCLDEASFDVRKPALDSTYQPIDDVFDPAHRIRNRGSVRLYSDMALSERIVNRARTDFNQQFNRHLLSLGLLLGKLRGVEVSAFVNPGGTLDYVACRLDKHSLNEFDRVQVEQSLCAFFSAYNAMLTGKAPYRLYLSFLLTGSTLADKRAQLNRFITQNKPEKGVVRTIAELATTQPDTVTTITLEKLDLTDVPRSLSRFNNLEHLNLNDNELTTLPRFVFRLPRLSTLNVSGNRLTDKGIRCRRNRHVERINLQFNQLHNLPRQLPRNRHLLSLWVGHNDLSAGLRPRVLRRLRSLTDLNLYQARLQRLPTAIGRLKRLETLDLYYNQLRDLPVTIGSIPSLQHLALSYNQLGRLPAFIGELGRLRTLYARSNSLTSLPVSISNLRSLQTLDLSENALEDVPASIITLSISSLQELNISQNYLRSLPLLLLQTNRLKLLNIGNNPATGKEKIAELLPLIHALEKRQTMVYY